MAWYLAHSNFCNAIVISNWLCVACQQRSRFDVLMILDAGSLCSLGAFA